MKSIKRIVFSIVLVLLCAALCSCSGNGSYKGNYLYSGTPSYFTTESGDEFTRILENPFVETAVTASSYFSIDANTSSYPVLRRLIREGREIDPDAVRVEEMLNYFSYDYAEPEDGKILALSASMFDSPYNPETKLLTVGLAAQKVQFTAQRNNVVFLIDTSGSMYGDDRLGLVQTAFKMLTDNLNDDDRVSIVTYAGSSSVPLSGAYGSEKQKINAAIEDLSASGSTAGAEGINTAYRLAQQYFIPGGNNRVVLATDGDFNVGISNTKKLESFIKEKAKSGVYLSVFGVGIGNLKSEKMESLALNGNGTASYLDSPTEARRALVEQIGGTMQTVAKDVKAGITFNPDYVQSYRLIGYENKLMTEEEFRDSEKDAGELGSGHTVTVTYELKLTDKALVAGENIGAVEIHYKSTENSNSQEQGDLVLTLDVKTDNYHQTMTPNDTFVSSVVEFALIARNSQYKANASIDNVIERLTQYQTSDEYKQEFFDLVKAYKRNYSSTEAQ